MMARKNVSKKEEVMPVEGPKVEEPKVEEPKVEASKTEEPKVEASKTEEPKVEEPKVDFKGITIKRIEDEPVRFFNAWEEPTKVTCSNDMKVFYMTRHTQDDPKPGDFVSVQFIGLRTSFNLYEVVSCKLQTDSKGVIVFPYIYKMEVKLHLENVSRPQPEILLNRAWADWDFDRRKKDEDIKSPE